MSYISVLNFYQLPDANLKRENTVLNAALAKNKTGRKSATGIYYKHNLGAADNTKSPLSDPFEVCLEGEDWNDPDTKYVVTPNLTPGTGKTTVGCLGMGPMSSISDISVTKSYCAANQRTIKSMAFPLAYEKMTSKEDPSKTAMNLMITSNEGLCVTDNVMSAKRVGDIKFVQGACPAGYTGDPVPFNGFTLCKKFSDKPSAEVMKKYQDAMDDDEKARDDEIAATEKEAFDKLSLVEKIKKDSKYQMYVGGALAACCLIIAVCCIVLLQK